jgi:hypothetical protein
VADFHTENNNEIIFYFNLQLIYHQDTVKKSGTTIILQDKSIKPQYRISMGMGTKSGRNASPLAVYTLATVFMMVHILTEVHQEAKSLT